MTAKEKELSNPFSTGGGGFNFETQIQASFIALMLSNGYSPLFPNNSIFKIMLQAKHAGFYTDDVVVFTKGMNPEEKLLGSIKHNLSFTKTDSVFEEVIQAAWSDFESNAKFKKSVDKIAVITGPLSAQNVNDVRQILEWARHSGNSSEYFTNIEKVKFSSKSKRDKLEAFTEQLKKIKPAITTEEIYNFLKHFYVLSYDLDIKSGVTLALLHSHISQFNQTDVSGIWAQLVLEAQSANQNAGTITKDNLPRNLLEKFKQKAIVTIPEEYTEAAAINWATNPFADELAVSLLIGSWNENNPSDIEIIGRLLSGS